MLSTSMTERLAKLGKYFLLSLIVVAGLLLIKPSYLYAKSVVAQVLLAHAWHKSQHSLPQKSHKRGQETDQQVSQQPETDHFPWPWADSYPVAKLSYRKGNVSWIILSGMTGRAMAFAPSWLEDSAKPNQYGNTVISAHNDSHFQSLESTDLGDEFLLEDRQGKVLTYRIITIDIVSEYDTSPYLFQDDTMITLITCYPFAITNTAKTRRLVIQAVSVKN